MKKTIFKRSICGFIAIASLLSFTACGKQDIPMASKENVYTATNIEMPQDFDYVNLLGAYGDDIYVIGTKSESSGEGEDYTYSSKTILSVMDTAGTEKNSTVLAEDDGSGNGSKNIQKMCVADDGSIVLLVNSYTWNDETGESTSTYSIDKYDQNGTLIKSADITKSASSDDGYVYYDTMVIGNDGNYYLSGNNNVYVLDDSGNLVFQITGEDSGNDSGSYINAICKTSDGRMAAVVNSYSYENDTYTNTNTVKIIDAASKGFSDEYSINSNYYNFYNGGGDYDIYVGTDNALNGIKLATGEVETVIDWLKSGFDATTMDSATILSDGRILCTTYEYDTQGGGYSWSSSDMLITILTKVDPSTIADKQLITISALYLDYRIKQQIVEFNKTNDKYQIEVTTYNYYDDGTGNYDAGITKFNNDLISGNIPDIILLNYATPIDSYISKGMLADIYTFIDKDDTINKEDYLQNVFEASSVNGKLYSLIPSFTVSTVAGKSSIVGTNEGWTMADFKAVADAHPDSMMLSDMTKSNFLTNAVSYSMQSYVDRETGECHFNTDNFKSLLEYANTFPEEIDWQSVYDSNPNYWDDQQKWYREDKCILEQIYLYDFTRIRSLEQGDFGEPITFVGFPCDNGNGSVISADSEIAIMAKAKNPDGAWEFVKYFLSDEYQNSVSGSFPIKLSAYDKLKEDAKQKPFYLDDDGNKVEYDNTYYLGDQQIKIGVNTDEDNERMMNFIQSINSCINYDQELMNIITEEAGAYFSGQKSVDEVVDIIQNRANTYISENR